jgi:two-component system chemotaxis response regulator CheB
LPQDLRRLTEKCRRQNISVVAIGASSGGVEALGKLLPSFKRPSSLVVLVVLHLPPTSTNLLPSLFRDQCSFRIKEAEPGEIMRPETIYIAPPDYHLSSEKEGFLSLSNEAEVNFSRPSIDVLFASAAHAFQRRAMGILLTGASQDGAQGLAMIQKSGGIVIVQDPEDAVTDIMPRAGIEMTRPDLISDVEGICDFIKEL